MHRPGAARVQFNAATTIGFKKPLWRWEIGLPFEG
jgi:hypothetical protein